MLKCLLETNINRLCLIVPKASSYNYISGSFWVLIGICNLLFIELVLKL